MKSKPKIENSFSKNIMSHIKKNKTFKEESTNNIIYFYCNNNDKLESIKNDEKGIIETTMINKKPIAFQFIQQNIVNGFRIKTDEYSQFIVDDDTQYFVKKQIALTTQQIERLEKEKQEYIAQLELAVDNIAKNLKDKEFIKNAPEEIIKNENNKLEHYKKNIKELKKQKFKFKVKEEPKEMTVI
jgi:valyl-tRNA synthetase